MLRFGPVPIAPALIITSDETRTAGAGEPRICVDSRRHAIRERRPNVAPGVCASADRDRRRSDRVRFGRAGEGSEWTCYSVCSLDA
jgi:hypothetical protein